jgi:hypothetical protein
VTTTHSLLGKRVKVTLWEGQSHPKEVVTGKLLSFGEYGSFVILDDNDEIHYCWPLLKIEEA